MHYKTAMIAGASLSAMIFAAPVAAQAQSSGPEVAEIVVTAQRRAEKLEDVPVAVVAVSESALESAGINKFQELGQITSGVSISRIGPYSQPAVRGVSSSLFGNGLENNVAVYIDGFYQPDSMGLNGDLANVESIQILKGPQGTLYGRNATGGAILMTSKSPSYDKLTGRIGAGYGNYNDRSVQGYLTGPITDKIAFSIAGSNRKNHGFIKDVGARAIPASLPQLRSTQAAEEFWAAPYLSRIFRVKLEAKPTDWATISLGYNYAKISDARTNTWTEKRYQIASLFPPGSATELDKSSMNFRPINSQTTREYTLTGKFDTPAGQISTYLGYAKRNAHLLYDFDGTKLDTVSADARYPESTYQAALDYAINAVERLDLVVGASYYQDVFGPAGVRYANFNPVNLSNIKRKAEAYAFYADATYQLTDKLFLTGGARYSHEEQRIPMSASIGLPVNPATRAVFTNLSEKWSATTFRAVIRYEIADRTNVYASFSQGFKSGTFNALSAFTTPQSALPVDNEDIDAYEVGFKTAQGQFRFNAAAFYYDYTNFQVSLTVPVDPTNPLRGTTTAVGNAPKAEVYGVEADIQAAVTESFNVRAAVSYTHGRYKEFPNASGTGLRAVPTINIVPQTQDWSGLKMLRAPAWTASLGADYTVPAFNGSLKLAGSIYYSSSYIPNNISVYGPLAPAGKPANKQRYVSPKYATANVSAAWTAPGDKLTLTGYVNNVTDERHHSIHSGSTFGDYIFYSDPRMYGVKVSYDF